MEGFIDFTDEMLAVLTLGSQIVLGVLLLLGLVNSTFRKKVFPWFGERVLVLALIVALTSTLGSLFYSEIAGYHPCKLCWFERIFMYPQVILFAVALWKKDKNAIYYSFPLSILGLLLSGYHYLLQRGVAPELNCDAVGYSPSCAKVFVMEFGYITIPLEAFTGFLLILSLLILSRNTRSSI